MWNGGDSTWKNYWPKRLDLIGTEAKTGVTIDMAKRKAYSITTDAHSTQAEEMRIKVKAFKEMIERRMVRDGWNGYLLSFMFHPVPGATTTKLQIMGEAVYRFYATFLTRVVRNPNSVFQLTQRPLLIAVPDYPVPKHRKQKLSDVTVNDGLHMHGLLVVPWDCRLKEDVVTHLQKHDALYRKAPLRRIDIQPIEEKLGFVVDYVFKSVKKRRVCWDDVILLPKSSSELKGPMSEMKQEMAKWIDLGLFPKMVRDTPGPRFDGTPEEKKRLLKLAKRFRTNFEINFDRG
jgi:hypothetical protein